MTSTANAWKLSQLEFYTAWQALGRDRMPFPIEFRTDIEFRSDLDRECAEAARRLVDLSRSDDGLYRALQALAQPQVHVMVFGYRLDGRERMVRMHAGIDGDGIGGVLVQEPGPAPDLDAAGDIRVYLHGPGGAVGRMVSLLPDVAAGRSHGVSINRLDLAPSETWTPGGRRSPGEQAMRFFRMPYRTYVEIKVDLGAALDGWQDSGSYLRVVDFVGEGRYLLTLGDRVEATPLTADKLRASIQQLVDRAVREQRSSMWG
ncbi:ESX secretion-associated protein EspG [Nocardia miyunensis]|uniref:ESX secretion-associated protein EspG n=1 Tax=Nocardia miyunensis TaxID=282684 RepID=UPI0008376865|nr:ESX secretion-associated protein EspG [Nocardia miyunensis]